MDTTMPPIELAERLLLLLALGLFFGLAFEEVYKRDEPEVPGGIRTFPTVALAGAMLFLVEPHHLLAFIAGLLAMAAWRYAFLRIERRSEAGPGRTLMIPVSNLLVYVLGPIALAQPPWVAVGATVAAVLLVGWREQMHGFVRLVPEDEVLTAGKFLILVGIVLPLVPDSRLVAAAPVTPYHVWLAVIAVSGLSYLTYLVQRYRLIRGGVLFPALVGGAYSSTATTVVLAKRHKGSGEATARAVERYHRRDCRDVSASCGGHRVLQPAAGSDCAAGPRLSLHPRSGAVVVGVAKDRARLSRDPGNPCEQPIAADDGSRLCWAVPAGIAGYPVGRSRIWSTWYLHPRRTRRRKRH